MSANEIAVVISPEPTLRKDPDHDRLRELLQQTFGYSTGEINELRELAINVGELNPEWRDRAQFRAAVETLAAINHFDEASTQMVRRANRFKTQVLALAVGAALMATAAMWIAWLTYRLAGY